MKPTLMLLLCLTATTAFADKQQEKLLRRIEYLKTEYDRKQEQLQDVTEARWREKQKQVKRKEQDNEQLSRIRADMERLYNDIARVREEVLSRERMLQDEESVLEAKREEWKLTTEAVGAKLEKLQKRNLRGFPLGQDIRIAALAELEHRFSARRNAIAQHDALVSTTLSLLADGATVGLARRPLVLPEGEVVHAEVLRIGNCLAYAMGPDGRVFYLRGIRPDGPNRFSWKEISNTEMKERLTQLFPLVIEQRVCKGSLPIDILQNDYSRSLLGEEEITLWSQAEAFARSGGPVLIPLALIVLWALYLVLNRLTTYARWHRRNYRIAGRGLGLLDDERYDEALSTAQHSRGVLARILATCLRNRSWKRPAAEKAVGEMLLAETPSLDKHLDTLAVLAAAAPLLGLLGTVTGMIRLFEVITRFGTGDPKLMAGGISEALITTEVGLAIAIPVLLLHNFLRNRRNRIQSELETSAMGILNRLWPDG